MKKISLAFCLTVPLLLSACAGMKVINPNEKNNEGTLALDTSGGQLRLVETYTCKLDSMGKHYQALGKTESEARDEVVAKCRDNAVLSFCKPEKTTCVKN
jgi:hypothetical protein